MNPSGRRWWITGGLAESSMSVEESRWISEGHHLARQQGQQGFESIISLNTVERAAFAAKSESIKASGRHLLEQVQQLDEGLSASGFDPARHLRDLAQGRADLVWALLLTLLNGVLAVLVLSLGATSILTTVPLALLVLTTAVPVEEFFAALDDKDSVREGVFLTLCFLALGASFYLGSLRGLFMMSLNCDYTGPAGEALFKAGAILKYTLGIHTMASEVLCGYKWYAVRKRLLSSTARAAKKREELSRQLVSLHSAIKAAEAEPEIRQELRTIGARQYLAEAAKRSVHAHLRQAVIGAVAVLLAILGLLFFSSKASAGSTVPALVTVALVDLTKSSSENDLKANVTAVNFLVNTTPDGGRILVLAVSDGFGNPRVLLDRTVHGHGLSGLELQAAREAATAAWTRVAADLVADYDHTAIVGTLGLLPYLIDAQGFHLFIFSDGREDVAVNIEKVTVIDGKATMKTISVKKTIPRLPGVRVHMLGVSPQGKTAEYMTSLRSFWTTFFQSAGASLVTFRIDRTMPERSER
jgi:hypothetical protein